MNIYELNGLELMTKIKDGIIPQPPFAQVIPMKPIFVEMGKVTFKAVADKNYANPMGTTHGGFISSLIDTASSCAVHTMLEKGEIYGTIELNVKLLRPIPTHLEVFGVAEIVTRTKSLGIANCIVKDTEGKIYGSGSVTCMIKRLNENSS